MNAHKKNKHDNNSISKIQTIKARREEDEKMLHLTQSQFEKAQLHIESVKSDLNIKTQIQCEDYLKFWHRHFKNIKSKIQDSYYVACVPAITCNWLFIDSIVFKEDLRK